jgi:hypothetical protein
MAEELDELVAREFQIFDDVKVPELWDRIVALADTEPVEHARGRRRWPAMAAAAVVVAVVGAGLVVWLRDEQQADEPEQADDPPSVVADVDNTVKMVMRSDDIDLSPTAIAGWVSLEINNQTDNFRRFEVRPLLPGTTYDEAIATVATFDDGDPDGLAAVSSDAVVGGLNGPRDAGTVGIPITAGDYLVVSNEVDANDQYVPGTDRVHELRVLPGTAGQPPTPTIVYEFIGDTMIGPTSTSAGRITITLEEGDEAPRGLLVANLRDGVTHADWERWASEFANGVSDYDQQPADSYIVLGGTAAGRTLTLDLDSGPVPVWASHDFSQPSGSLPGVWLQVD